MAYTTEIRTAEAGIPDKLAAWWKGLQEVRTQRKLFNETVRELNALSGRELADLGISRSEIRHVAWHATYGK